MGLFGCRLFNIFLYLVYLSLFAVVGLDMNFCKVYLLVLIDLRMLEVGYPWFSYGFMFRNFY